jgi:hypothetical protein
MIRVCLVAAPSLATFACANGGSGHSKEESARVAYHDCLKSAAAELQSKPLTIAQIGTQAVARCARERIAFTEALISEIGETTSLTCDDSEAKVPCDLRDSFERRYLKAIGNMIATARGIPVEKELEY